MNFISYNLIYRTLQNIVLIFQNPNEHNITILHICFFILHCTVATFMQSFGWYMFLCFVTNTIFTPIYKSFIKILFAVLLISQMYFRFIFFLTLLLESAHLQLYIDNVTKENNNNQQEQFLPPAHQLTYSCGIAPSLTYQTTD